MNFVNTAVGGAKKLWFLRQPNFAPISLGYRNDPKFLDRYAWANSADPDQAAPRQ